GAAGAERADVAPAERAELARLLAARGVWRLRGGTRRSLGALRVGDGRERAERGGRDEDAVQRHLGAREGRGRGGPRRNVLGGKGGDQGRPGWTAPAGERG